ncbi:hypothetical protein PsYK624_173080 [Phanerochaete sordida]|uniref:Uncharacterized protein n=1 Tax=Phanerochaete sordida TaxID=48140 RepID=A0A9P3GSY2_9APHY|nr:hypothetical protein PsYK624_173080 [Phanerochaete sordida]
MAGSREVQIHGRKFRARAMDRVRAVDFNLPAKACWAEDEIRGRMGVRGLAATPCWQPQGRPRPGRGTSKSAVEKSGAGQRPAVELARRRRRAAQNARDDGRFAGSRNSRSKIPDSRAARGTKRRVSRHARVSRTSMSQSKSRLTTGSREARIRGRRFWARA